MLWIEAGRSTRFMMGIESSYYKTVDFLER